MKIGIVTQQLLNNYGGVLQNYALQCVLRKLGHTPLTIDYIRKMSRSRYIKLWLRALFYNLFHSTKRPLPQGRVVSPRHPHFADFVETHISRTKVVHKYTESLIADYGLEAVITGSDQVWRPRYNRGVLTNMFLDFVKNDSGVKKIAYAASFGVDSWEYKPNKAYKCRRLARELHAVSVREESGVTLCRAHLHVDAIEVLDPTLLLSSEEYQQILPPKSENRERYVAAYILDSTPEKIALIEQEAKRRGVPCRIFGAGKAVELSVAEWLTIFRDAEYIITDSFHGCVFSIIFRREFAAIINRNRGASRFLSLFGKFGLLDRVVIDASRGVLPNQPIDWSVVEQKLRMWQELSLNYLAKALCR